MYMYMYMHVTMIIPQTCEKGPMGGACCITCTLQEVTKEQHCS